VKVQVQIARSRADVVRCQNAIAEVYNRDYEVVFSEDRSDLEAKIEPWPHRYLMVLHEGTLAATIGIYLRNTYTERYGQLERADFQRLIDGSGATGYSPDRMREVTKLVVPHAFRGRNLARFTLGCGHARDFCQVESDAPQLMTLCSKRSITKRSIIDHVYSPIGLKVRHLKPFPFYKVHELYRSPTDPMDSYLMVPDQDIPARWYDLRIPGEYEVEAVMEGAR
jgi:hypothetical protein